MGGIPNFDFQGAIDSDKLFKMNEDEDPAKLFNKMNMGSMKIPQGSVEKFDIKNLPKVDG